MCFAGFGISGDPWVVVGGAEKHLGPYWPLTVKTPPSGGVLIVGAPARAGVLSGLAGPDKTPAPVGVLS